MKLSPSGDNEPIPLAVLKPSASEATHLTAAFMRVAASGVWVNGPEVGELESRMAEKLGVKHAVCVNSGTAALRAALAAADVGPGDYVVTTPFTFVASASAAVLAGASVHFADVGHNSFNIDPVRVHDSIEQLHGAGKRVKAIIPVHLFGECAEMAELLAIGKRYGIPVIEDAAQAIGAGYRLNGSRLQAGTMGTAGCFSFYPTKNLGGLGDGGMVVTNDAAIAIAARRFAHHGCSTPYDYTSIGDNLRMSEIYAATLLVELPKLEALNQARRVHALRYLAELRPLHNREVVTLPHLLGDLSDHVFHHFVIRAKDRDGLKAYLASQGISGGVYYPRPLDQQPCFRGQSPLQTECVNASAFSRTVLALPVYPELTENQQTRVIKAIKEYYGEASVS